MNLWRITKDHILGKSFSIANEKAMQIPSHASSETRTDGEADSHVDLAPDSLIKSVRGRTPRTRPLLYDARIHPQQDTLLGLSPDNKIHYVYIIV